MAESGADHRAEHDEIRSGELAGEFLDHLGTRIRELRTGRGLTVQQLADVSGISRRLMTQIELGQANPSLVTVTRIARQLGTEFTALVEAPEPGSPVVGHEDGTHLLVWRSPQGSTAYLMEATATRSCDLWLWRLEPGDRYDGHADPKGSEELFYAVSGEVTLRADDHDLVVRSGGSARLLSDRPYAYVNDGRSAAVFVRSVALAP